jgi:hypothetical protein
MNRDIVFAVPSGNRPDKVYNTLYDWHNLNFSTVGYFWDDISLNKGRQLCDVTYTGKRKSFAKLHNYMSDKVMKYFKGYICGADDLLPGENIHLLNEAVEMYDGKILWIFDGHNKGVMTHPVITRGWYEKYHKIFDERFYHNFCDRDLMIEAIRRDEVIRIENITFNHRHPVVTGEVSDIIYRLALRHYQSDKLAFEQKHTGEGFRLYYKRVPAATI